MENKEDCKEYDYKKVLSEYEKRRDMRRKSIRNRITKFIKKLFSHYNPEEGRRLIIKFLAYVGFNIVMYFLLYVFLKVIE